MRLPNPGLSLGVLTAALLAGSAGVSAQSAASAEKGNEVFDEQCGSCHYAYSADRKVGPGLKWLFSKKKLDSNGKPVNDANVLERIDKGGNGMPAYKDSLSKEDKADLMAYLKTL
jgi:mono/diheme cytochrome c family protein